MRSASRTVSDFPDAPNAAYRGLRHDLPLFMTRRGGKFELNIKRRVLRTGEHVEYWAADSLQSYITRLYAKAGITGASSHSGRRTFSTRLYAKTKDMETVRLLLGHDSIDVTMRYIDVDKRILRQAFIDVI